MTRLLSLSLLLLTGLPVGAEEAPLPSLVGLPKLKPLKQAKPPVEELTPEVLVAAPKAKRRDRPMAAVLESVLGDRVAAEVGLRVEAALQRALRADAFAEVLGPRSIRELLSLSAQAEIAGSPAAERLVTSASFLGAQRVVQARVTIDRDGYGIVLDAVSATDATQLRARRTGIQSLDQLDQLITELFGELSAKRALEARPAARAPVVGARTSAPAPVQKLNLVAGGLALAGGAAVGGSYLMMNGAQQTFDAIADPARDDVDSLLDAQNTARLVWGAGLGLFGVGAVTWSFAR